MAKAAPKELALRRRRPQAASSADSLNAAVWVFVERLDGDPGEQ